MLGTSNSDTIVQYCSAQKSVMTRILPSPAFSLSLDIARNLSTIGRTLPGLQYMISRMSSILSPRVGGVYHGQPFSGGQRWESHATVATKQADPFDPAGALLLVRGRLSSAY